MLLKTLNDHPQVFVPLQIFRQENQLDKDFINLVKIDGITEIPTTHTYAKQRNLSSTTTIVVKQGTWFHSHEFSGFCLIRNPLSFVDSMLSYNENEGLNFGLRPYGFKKYRKTFKRLLVWSAQMSSNSLYADISTDNCVISALCTFYNHRLTELLSYNKLITKYEHFVASPDRELKLICGILKLPYNPSITKAHLQYKKETIGHGRNDLSRPIDISSVNKWQSRQLNMSLKIIDLTIATANKAGYFPKYNMDLHHKSNFSLANITITSPPDNTA